MRLSVVLISYNALHFLKPCLQALTHAVAADRENTEIILVDNGSTDGTPDFIRIYYPETRLYVLPSNRGVAYARNRGIEIASGKYVWLLDADTVPNREAVEGMIAYMEEHPETGLCGTRLADASGCVQDSCKRFPSFALKLNNLLLGFAEKTSSPAWKEKLTERNRKYQYDDVAAISSPFSPDYLIGACQLIRREVIEKIGLLDERIFYGPEDADYCLRIGQAGWNIVYLPQYRMIHHWQHATRRKVFSRLAFRHMQGLIYFYFKYRRIH